MLELKNIYKTFNPGSINEKRALNGINLTLEDGDFVTIIGGNGAGKSTMLNAIAGVWPVDSGSVIIDGEGYHKAARTQKSKISGARIPGPHERDSCRYGNRRKSGCSKTPRTDPYPQMGDYKKRERRIC